MGVLELKSLEGLRAARFVAMVFLAVLFGVLSGSGQHAPAHWISPSLKIAADIAAKVAPPVLSSQPGKARALAGAYGERKIPGVPQVMPGICGIYCAAKFAPTEAAGPVLVVSQDHLRPLSDQRPETIVVEGLKRPPKPTLSARHA